jgi:hypothetical protein
MQFSRTSVFFAFLWTNKFIFNQCRQH